MALISKTRASSPRWAVASDTARASRNDSPPRFALPLAAGVCVLVAGLFSPPLSFTVFASPPITDLIITNALISPDGLVLAGRGGAVNGDFRVLATSDLAVPGENWTPLSTNSFDEAGNFSVMTSLASGGAPRFYQLQSLDNSPAPDFSLIGWATLNGGTTGGAGGSTVTVTTETALRNALNVAGPAIVQVNGAIDIGNTIIRDTSHKTLIGLGTNATLSGNLQFQNGTNLILRNLHLANPAGDAMTLQDFSQRIWVDHCSFGESGDGQLDITHGSDLITVSWCHFSYTNAANSHRFSSLIGHDDDNAAEDAGRLRVTYHHNWWSTLARERMPRVRFGQVHVFNTYYFAPGNNYCTFAAFESQLLIENNVYQSVDEPWRKEATGRVRAIGNAFVGVTGNNVLAVDSVFTPPYPYSPDVAADVTAVVTNHAGAGRGPFAP